MAKLMTVEELAEYLRFTKKTIYRLLKQGNIPAVKLGNKWRFDKNTIDEWLHKDMKGSKLYILVIDDDSLITSLFRETLEEKGYKAGDIVGTSGVEAFYEDTLRGVNGKREVEVDASGIPLREIEEAMVEPNPGKTMVLTLDKDLQKLVEESLRWGMERARTFYHKESEMRYKAPAGAAVVLDPRNGEILAMASEPTFNLADFVGGIDEELWEVLNAEENNAPIINRAIVGEYPPGSTFKAITALASLQDLNVTAYSPFYCNHIFNEDEFEDFPKTCF